MVHESWKLLHHGTGIAQGPSSRSVKESCKYYVSEMNPYIAIDRKEISVETEEVNSEAWLFKKTSTRLYSWFDSLEHTI